MLDGRASSRCRYGVVRRARRASTSTVADGEIVCVLGPSGSGKSTLLRGDRRARRPTRPGTCAWDGDDLAGVPPHRRGFGLMFQDHALFPHRDVLGNVAFGLRMQRLAARRGRAARPRERSTLVGLAGFEHRRVARALGRRAATGRARPRARARAAAADARRAARRARPRAARAARRRAARAVRPARADGRVRDPRPRRGVRARRPGRGDARGAHRAGRAPRPTSGGSPPTRSSPGSSAGTSPRALRRRRWSRSAPTASCCGAVRRCRRRERHRRGGHRPHVPPRPLPRRGRTSTAATPDDDACEVAVSVDATCARDRRRRSASRARRGAPCTPTRQRPVVARSAPNLHNVRRDSLQTPCPYPVSSDVQLPAPALTRTILVVEDEAPIAAAVATRLRSEGFAVEIAADGPTRRRAVRSGSSPTSWCSTSCCPGLDGLEVCRRHPARPAGPGPHAHRPRLRDRPRRRARRRRRRLPDEAVQHPRARRPRARAPAPRRPHARPRPPTPTLQLGDVDARPGDPPRAPRRRRSCTSRRPSSTCSRTSPRDPAASFTREELLDAGVGLRRRRPARARSTRTSARCAASSATTSSAPCTASGTRPATSRASALNRARRASPTRSTTLPSIKLKLGFVIAAAVAVTVFVFWVGIKLGMWPSVSGDHRRRRRAGARAVPLPRA